MSAAPAFVGLVCATCSLIRGFLPAGAVGCCGLLRWVVALALGWAVSFWCASSHVFLRCTSVVPPTQGRLPRVCGVCFIVSGLPRGARGGGVDLLWGPARPPTCEPGDHYRVRGTFHFSLSALNFLSFFTFHFSSFIFISHLFAFHFSFLIFHFHFSFARGLRAIRGVGIYLGEPVRQAMASPSLGE